MYAQFFGLNQPPFSIAPDPRYLFMSERHREALAHLLYGLSGGGGFVLLSGEIGAGKTTVCRCFLEQIPRRCNVAYIFNPKLTVTELLQSVCEEFRIPANHDGPGAPTVKDYVDPLNEFLLKTHAVGQDNVLIIDEAQMLSADVLEQLRLLTNLETNERKLLQIILIGQPELRTMLARPELEQLAQRVIARFHLEALSDTETEQYIAHRLAVAGRGGALPFDRKALQRIRHWSRGVPRRINLLCDRALLGAYASGTAVVNAQIVDKAAAEVFGKAGAPEHGSGWHAGRWAMLGAGLAGGAALAGVVALSIGRGPAAGPAKVTVAAASAASAASRPASGVAVAMTSAASASAASAPARAASAAAAWLTSTDLAGAFGSVTRDEKDAWRELAPAWRLKLGDGDPCQAAEREQVACYRSSNSTLAVIRQLGRPGILTLREDGGQPVYAVLTGLGEQSATLRMGGTTRRVALPLLARLWHGDFATFWRVPPGYDNKIVLADSGPLADWLVERLAKVEGQPVESGAGAFKERVASFQLAQGLKADGLAGATTFMQLNRAIGVDEPRLETSAPAPQERKAPMSYILDALRRAESERDRGGVPNIHAQQVPMTSLGRPSSRAALAPWIVAAAALLLLAVLAWRLLGRGDAVQVASAPAVPAPSAAPAPQPSVAVAPSPGLATAPAQTPTATPAQDPAAAPAPARVAPVAPRPAPTARAPAPAATTRAPARAPATAPAGAATTESDSDPAAPVARRASEPARVAAGPASQGVIYNRADLPPDIQRALPNLAIGGSSFSQDSASRMLILNGQVFHEGDPLGPDLTLEQIQLKAAVFRFKGYRYRITF